MNFRALLLWCSLLRFQNRKLSATCCLGNTKLNSPNIGENNQFNERRASCCEKTLNDANNRITIATLAFERLELCNHVYVLWIWIHADGSFIGGANIGFDTTYKGPSEIYIPPPSPAPAGQKFCFADGYVRGCRHFQDDNSRRLSDLRARGF